MSIEVKYTIQIWIPGDEAWHKEGSFEVSEKPQEQAGDVSRALWHGQATIHDDLGSAHDRSIVGGLSRRISHRCAQIAAEKRESKK
jgi:hypothetical protein